MKRLAVMLLVAVALAGCTSFQQQQKEKPDKIEVSQPTCRIDGSSCSSVKANRFSGDATVSITVNNFGEENVTLHLGEGGNGRNVMVSKCNDEIVRIKDFKAEKQSSAGLETMQGPAEIVLEKDSEAELRWTLDVVSSGSVSELGYSCPLDFELPMTQTIRSGKQVQIKKNDDVPDVGQLDATTTSRFPVKLKIDAPDSHIVGQGKLRPKGYLKNVGPGEITNITALQREDSADNILDEGSCEEGVELKMYGPGPRQGESYRLPCPVDTTLPEGARSAIEWIRFMATYDYTMPLSSKTIEVVPVAGGGG
ncbi:MAG: hypothetical protein SVW02_03720 [Candidatus Nanohaloarchaea archaeon]|nr:hypothetical protein [Candidatus Nanohaloarchaea archaeon]